MSSYFFTVALFTAFVLSGCIEKENTKEPKASRDFLAGEYYDYYQKKDSAFYYYNRVVQSSSDSLEKATAFAKMGRWQLGAGDYYSAQESLLLSIKALDEKDSTHFPILSATYNTLANTTLNVKDYPSAVHYYNNALRFAPSDLRPHFLNNIGVAYQKKGDYPKAIVSFDSALAHPFTDTALLAKIISNAARTRWLANSRFSPLPAYRKALAIRRQMGDSLGMNASFAHLSDYYASSRPDSSFYYALQRLQIAQRLNDPSDRLEALTQLINVSPAPQTKTFVEQYLLLDDSLTTVKSKDRNQFALIKFDAEKNKADNLLLAKRISEQRLIMAGILLLSTSVVIFLRSRARARRRRMKEENDRAMQQLQLATSQKVHDVVANGLYRIMNKLEHEETIEKEPLLDEMESLYEQSRNLSYEPVRSGAEGFALRIQQLIASYHTSRTRVTVVGTVDALAERLTAVQKKELELVVAELLVNMKKHSQARTVVISFDQARDRGMIEYSDDGVGFAPDPIFGNGLRHTVNRIQAIRGEISFEKNGEAGTSILISFPLEP